MITNKFNTEHVQMIQFNINKFLLMLTFFTGISGFAQNNVGIGTSSPDPSAVLDISSETKKGGLLMPRVPLLSTTDVVTIPAPAKGLMVYNTLNSGTYPNAVYEKRIYFWDGTKWQDIADIKSIRSIILPQVFFIQETASQDLTTAETTAMHSSGTDALVTFDNASVTLNNGNNITLTNNTMKVTNSGKYEVSGFLNYNPDLKTSQYTDMIYKIQLSTNTGTSWTTIGQTKLVWGLNSGGFSRTSIIPSTNVNLSVGNLIRVVVSKTPGFGSRHGNDEEEARVSIPNGLTFSKGLRIYKLD